MANSPLPMPLPPLEDLARNLEEEAHLLVWECAGRLEIVALIGASFEDAFPLPLHVQSAAADAGMILDTTTAARLEITQLPEDFWDDLEEVPYGGKLRVSMLGRSGQKYLHIYRGVREGGEPDLALLRSFDFSEGELLKVTQWIRERAFFDHQSGELLMGILTQLH